MQKLPLLLRAAPLAAFALLAACNSQPETLQAGNNGSDGNEAATAAAKVTLPPALSASHTYRCKDNSLIYVDFFDDGLTADLKTTKEGAITKLTAAEKGKPFEANGYKITGDGTEISYEAPGKGSQSCKA